MDMELGFEDFFCLVLILCFNSVWQKKIECVEELWWFCIADKEESFLLNGIRGREGWVGRKWQSD